MHRMDAIWKFAWLIAIACIGYIISQPIRQFMLLVVITACGLILAKIPPKTYFAGFGVFLTFAMFIFLMQLVFAPPLDTKVYFHWFLITISQQSIKFGSNLGLRVLNVGSSALIFIKTTEPSRLVHGMITMLRVPYRFAYAFYAALRYIPVFENEAANIMNAHAVRGGGLDEGWLSKLKLFSRLTVPLLISGLRKAKNAAIAMEGRAFGAFANRTASVEYPIPLSGVLFTIAWWIFFVVYLVILLSTTGFIKS